MNLKQNDMRFNLEINNYGCLFMCLAHITAEAKGVEFTTEQLLEVYKQGKTQGFIGERCYIKNHDHILKLLGSPLRWQARYDADSYNNTLANNSKIIGRFHTNFKYHFVVVDQHLNTIYDPWDYSNPIQMQLGAINRVDLYK